MQKADEPYREGRVDRVLPKGLTPGGPLDA